MPRHGYVGESTIRADLERGVVEWVIPNPDRLSQVVFSLRPQDVQMLIEKFIREIDKLSAQPDPKT